MLFVEQSAIHRNSLLIIATVESQVRHQRNGLLFKDTICYEQQQCHSLVRYLQQHFFSHGSRKLIETSCYLQIDL